MVKILCLGDICLDYFKKAEKIYLGGCSLNSYSYLKGRRAEVFLAAPLGSGDEHREKVESSLKGEDVIFFLRENKNLLLEIDTNDNGEKKYHSFEDELIQEFQWSREELSLLEGHDIILSPYFLEIRKFIDPVIKLWGDKMILDLHDCEDLQESEIQELSKKVMALNIGCDKFSRDFLDSLSKDLSFLSVTLGEKGSILFYNKECFEHTPAKRVNVVDSTGAGDCYLANLIYALKVEQLECLQAMEVAHLQAVDVLQHFGANRELITI